MKQALCLLAAAVASTTAAARELLQGPGVAGGAGAVGTYNWPASSANSLLGSSSNSSAPAPAPTSQFCSCPADISSPVCGADSQTYGSACIAKCANVVVAHTGSCNTCSDPMIGRAGSCDCGSVPYSPVCADGLTWQNACDAQCTGRPCFSTGVCEYQPGATNTPTPAGNAAAGGVAAAASNTSPPSPSGARYNYGDALHKTFLFYEIQRSGANPSTRVAWRGSSCLDCKGPGGEDMSGGYYEAGGSYLKLGLPSAYTVSMLAYAVYAFPDGFRKTNELSEALAALKWGADFLVNAHPNADNFVAVVGNDTDDFDYYGPPEYFQLYNPPRPSVYINAQLPGSEIAAEAAAALAATYLVFTRVGGAQYAGDAATYLDNAKSLFQLAIAMGPASYSGTSDPILHIHDRLYPNKLYQDEMAWGAAWLYAATGTASYLQQASTYYNQWFTANSNYGGFAPTNSEKGPALHVLLSSLDPGTATYATNAQAFFQQYLQGATGSGGVQHTQRGLAYPFHYGALRPAMSTAFLALVYAGNNGTSAGLAAQLRNYATYQANYALGDSGRSWIIGVGSGYPTSLWHKWSYNSILSWPLRDQNQVLGPAVGPWTVNKTSRPVVVMASKFQLEGSYEPQRQIAYGALFGAPFLDDSLVAGRKDYSYAEPTTEGQGGLVGTMAGLAQYYTTGQSPVTDAGLNLGGSSTGTATAG